MGRKRLVLAAHSALALVTGVSSWSGSGLDQPGSSTSDVTSAIRRRLVHQWAQTMVVATFAPDACQAGEIGARVTQAVTTSDLGISVRRSVVRAAQVMDSWDLQAERWSDRWGLGTERATRPGKPLPVTIPDPQPLDAVFAAMVLAASDDAFCDIARIPRAELQTRIQTVSDTVRLSFQRSGLALSANSIMETASQFNFVSYVHFKAYADLLIAKNIDFRKFKSAFENRLGQQIAASTIPDWSSRQGKQPTSTPEATKKSLYTAVGRIESLATAMVDKGLVAKIDLAPLDPDDVEDWSQGLSGLSWSVALDGDITLQSQILLQEQGFRLYPNFARYAIQSILQELQEQDVTTEDYYMDTDYNSDPDKFEVKEVLVNINIESRL
jgi:hypothetical protein